MSWSEVASRERVKARAKSKQKISVVKLTREMDFDNLGPNEVRRAEGAHVYCDVSNFHSAVANAGGDKEKQKKVIRRASILRRIQAELAASHEVGRIQMQAARFH